MTNQPQRSITSLEKNTNSQGASQLNPPLSNQSAPPNLSINGPSQKPPKASHKHKTKSDARLHQLTKTKKRDEKISFGLGSDIHI